MSSFNDSLNPISLQKPNGQPPNLPPMDEYNTVSPQLLEAPRFCKISWGARWLIMPLRIFKDYFGFWLVIGMVFLIVTFISIYIPVIEHIFGITSVIASAVITLICAAQFQNEDLDFSALWSKFKIHLLPLIILNVLFVVGVVIVLIPLIIFFGGVSLVSLIDIETIQYQNFPVQALVFSALVSLVLLVLLFMAMFFAPALIVMHDLGPKSAMKHSLKGCLANMLPAILYSLIILIALPIFLRLTLGFGIVVAIPWLMIASYVSYRDVWTDQPLSAS
jgi:hypothetical protein